MNNENRRVEIFSLERVPENVLVIWNILEENGFDTYLVGGAVRDMIMKNEPNDFDLATSATPDEIMEVMRRDMWPDVDIDYFGASFGVVVVDGVEIATFRGEVYGNTGSDKDIAVIFVNDIKDDLGRRDFTINAIAVTSSGILIDPFVGMEDIKNGILRFVGDPVQRIKEDSNRLIRACRFVSKLHFCVHHESAKAMIENHHMIDKVKPERIRVELLKAMETESPSLFFSALLHFRILEHIFPEMCDCFGHDGGKHHNETVWEHNMLVGDCLPSSDKILKLAGFLHDIGKPVAWKESIESIGEGKFINHHKIGEKILEKRLFDLKFSTEEINKICGLVGSHMFFISGLSPKAQIKLLRNLDAYGLNWRDLVRLRIADHKGNLAKGKMTPSEIKEIIKSFTQVEDTPRDVKSLSVSGGQIIQEFMLTPGKIVSTIQKALLEHVLETGEESSDCLLLQCQKIISEIA